jgi:hypothetical protein
MSAARSLDIASGCGSIGRFPVTKQFAHGQPPIWFLLTQIKTSQKEKLCHAIIAGQLIPTIALFWGTISSGETFFKRNMGVHLMDHGGSSARHRFPNFGVMICQRPSSHT